ncbi:MAG: DUF2807 domain-containing protein [Bacteroidales bacterium]|jgi:hypothetical protein|nr:DUF2807 domain-containing protein [Bacteroidales bacterium]
MKAKLFILIAVCLTLVGCIYNTKRINGNGNITSKELILEPFNKIKADANFDINVFKGDTDKIIVTIDENLQQYISASVANNVLNLDYTDHISLRHTRFVVDVYMKELSAIDISGAAQVKLADVAVSPAFDISISGAGKMDGAIRTDKLKIRANGACDLDLQGKATTAYYDISGAANIDCRKLNTDSVYANAVGAVNIELLVNSFLDAKASGAGTIEYSGNPFVQKDVSGAGRVVRKR